MKPINTKKLIAAFKATPKKPIHYQPYGGGAGHICNGCVGATITDHDAWKDLLLKLGSEAEKGRIEMIVQENLADQLLKAAMGTCATALPTGISVDKTDRTADLFEVDRKIVVLDRKYVAPFEGWTHAYGSAPLSPIRFEGFGYTAIVCPVHPKTVATTIRRLGEMFAV